MYLNSVLLDIQKESAPPKALNAEHLYKMNEAVFNLPEEDVIDQKMSNKLFQAVTKIRKAYNSGKVRDTDNNFFYDYVALLGTLQNQHFFSGDQTDQMLSWVKEAIDDGSSQPAPAAKETGPSKGEEKKLSKLQEDNKRLKEELDKLQAVSKAVEVLKSFKLETPAAEPKAKAKSKAKAKAKAKESEDGEEAKDDAPKEKKAKSKAKAKPKPKWAPKESKTETEGEAAS
uniref:Uncharacterized protein n=1 Tax=Alexandrium catenella TaxID=2925 RepID=A0A7S1WFC4_ALECA